MSKISAKSRYTQLMSWLSTYPPSPKFKNKDKNKSTVQKYNKKESRLNYYQKKGY